VTRRINIPAPAKDQGGMSLIEVLVSVLVLGVGLMGIAAMQSLALRGGQSSLETSQAVMASSSILEAIRANPTQASSYNMAKTCTVPSGGTLVTNDKAAWITSLKSTIGSGVATDTTTCGQISNCSATTVCKVTVFWNDARGGADNGGAARKLDVEARI